MARKYYKRICDQLPQEKPEATGTTWLSLAAVLFVFGLFAMIYWYGKKVEKTQGSILNK